jgi:hypothetical protein
VHDLHDLLDYGIIMSATSQVREILVLELAAEHLQPEGGRPIPFFHYRSVLTENAGRPGVWNAISWNLAELRGRSSYAGLRERSSSCMRARTHRALRLHVETSRPDVFLSVGPVERASGLDADTVRLSMRWTKVAGV